MFLGFDILSGGIFGGGWIETLLSGCLLIYLIKIEKKK